MANIAVEPAYPLGPPTVDAEGTISVHRYLQQPTRVTRMISDITLKQFLLEYLFRGAGGVSGGSVIYDQPSENDLYLTRDLQKIEPGQEYPIIAHEQPIPLVALVEKWGAKTFITDEARDRNDQGIFAREVRKIANTLTRKLNQRAVEEVEAALTANAGQVIPGNDWSVVTTQGTSPTAYSAQAVGDFAAIWEFLENQEMGMVHNMLIMNPQEVVSLMNAYGTNWRQVLTEYGYGNFYSSIAMPAGTAYSIARGELGQMHTEAPLATISYREEGKDQTWVQTGVRPLMYVNNPFAVIKLTGLAG